MRTATAAAIAALSGAAHAQVTSTWTGGDLIPDWSDEDNWEHDDPSVDSYPNNGNEGKTYTAILKGLATMSESITIDGLDMQSGAGIGGAIDLTVLGVATFQSNNAGFLTAGTVNLNGAVGVPGLLSINDTQVNTDHDIFVGDTGNGAVKLDGSAMLNAGSITFQKDGHVTSQNGDAPMLHVVGIVKNGGFGLSTVQCTTEFEETLGSIECTSGELRFAQPIQGSNYPVTMPNIGVSIENGAKLTFSRTVQLSGTTSANVFGQLIFNNGTFDLSGGTLKAGGMGTVELVGGGATMSNGTIDCSNTCPFQFIAGTIGPAPITNKDAFQWSGGVMEGNGPGQVVFVNDNGMDDHSRTIISMQGVGRIIRSGTFQNKSTFLQTHNVDLGQDGTIVNDPFTFWTINDANLLPVANTDNNAFINNGNFIGEGIGTSVVSVCFENNQIVISKSGTLQFKDAKQFDEDAKTLIGGNWCVEGTGQILFDNTDLEVIGPGATVQAKGGGKIGLEKVKGIEGCLGLYAASTTFDEPVDLSGKLDIGGVEEKTEVSIVDLLTDDGNLIIRSKGEVEVESLTVSGDAAIDFFESIPLTGDSPSLTTTSAEWTSGSLHGTGTWTCQEPLQIGGEVDPGVDGEFGHFVFDGDAGFEPTSALAWGFGDAPGPANQDVVSVTGQATLGGALQVTQLGEALQPGEARTILSAASIVGAFDVVTLPEGHALRYTATEVQLIVCVGDFNGDGLLNILDFVAFQNAFTSGDASADCNGDGMLNILDFVCFQNEFEAGC